MDAETRDKIHSVELTQKDHGARMDGFERLLQEQAKAFTDFKDMVNRWAKRFAYIVVGIAAINLEDGTGGSVALSMIGKVFGL